MPKGYPFTLAEGGDALQSMLLGTKPKQTVVCNQSYIHAKTLKVNTPLQSVFLGKKPTRAMVCNQRSCMHYDHSTCIYCDHNTCMYYDDNTRKYHDDGTCKDSDHSTCMYYVVLEENVMLDDLRDTRNTLGKKSYGAGGTDSPVPPNTFS